MNILNLIAMAIGYYMMAQFVGVILIVIFIEWPNIKDSANNKMKRQ